MAKILYCDSDPGMLELFRNYLTWYGFDLTGVAGTETVMEALRDSDFRLLICDRWTLPQDGFSLCDSVRLSERPKVREIPILMIGPEEPTPEESKWLRRHGINFLIKYKNPEQWYQRITTILKTDSPS